MKKRKLRPEEVEQKERQAKHNRKLGAFKRRIKKELEKMNGVRMVEMQIKELRERGVTMDKFGISTGEALEIMISELKIFKTEYVSPDPQPENQTGIT